ncbi:class I adenylate-forming enzyme family protein [Pseudomonas frederiksbergensis]|uniref:AMP-dependent synthetase/ligase domain-containing protein n=1 Tax=Pseudomonas frederiksbergensis TaxID=104087 RepID=A0A423HQX5_9PSED|nr:class I adenylate-forming enzyme family protein [Pseudomonas frederiksbergensis]RON15583.1 hypothetical protein BK662_12615 [Pseudomonas frederiksbergensis]
MSAAAKLLLDGIEDFSKRFTDTSSVRIRFNSILDSYANLNLEPGSAIIILTSNSFEFLQHWIAIVANGLVPVPASPSLKSTRILDLQESLKISGLVGAKINPALYGANHYVEIGTLRFLEFRNTPAAYAPDEALILTSGTSGINTACVHSISSMVNNAAMHNKALGIHSSDTQLLVLPMYYSYAMVAQAIGSMISGCKLIIDGPPFTVERFANLSHQKNITVSAITPTLVREILQSNSCLPEIRVLSVGGDQLKSSDVDAIRTKPFVNELYITYGLTEAGPRVATLAAHSADVEQLNSVGLPLEGIETRIDSPRENEPGELLIKTPTALHRKVGDNVTQPLRADGFLATGDLFTKDKLGVLRFVGRTKDFVFIRGEKVNTKSISQTAERHPAVRFAKTTLTTDGKLSLAVSPREDTSIETSDLSKFLEQRLQRFEMPAEITHASFTEFQK